MKCSSECNIESCKVALPIICSSSEQWFECDVIGMIEFHKQKLNVLSWPRRNSFQCLRDDHHSIVLTFLRNSSNHLAALIADECVMQSPKCTWCSGSKWNTRYLHINQDLTAIRTSLHTGDDFHIAQGVVRSTNSGRMRFILGILSERWY